ncbi:bifunctional tetrahydrofolate synthase/dihydrofolate synthase [uncultured Succinatimonas sp.]|uniref:bifunctional tetrahydrofolate synthase/dihydrofolate synthase n=1 Tax=uncultured Succinatimonas sp. TaxID=1262973 RepID=UPI0025FE7258|nr:bifunctional tetrahydrofolate synthase/dihydrofolate synthase [uncultured Succinatimonas sp.]
MTENLSVKNRSLQEWLGYLEGIDPNRIELGLNRVKVVAAKLNLLKIAAYTIEVAGTNGKGSTAALIAGALNKSGIKTGLYTSPHLHVFTERVNIGGKNVDEALLCKAFYAVYEAAEQCGVSLTYFEYTTLAAFYCFKAENVQAVVLEIGLGGRLDAVNVVDADIAVITSIGFDHTALLGNTLAKIAYEKAGIIKKGAAACVVGKVDFEALNVIEAKAKAENVPLFCEDRDFNADFSDDGFWYKQGNRSDFYPLPKIPYICAASSITVLNLLKNLGADITVSAVNSALKTVSLPGRMQKICSFPTIYFDVAHNPPAALHLKQSLSNLPQTKGIKRAVVGMLKDKDIESVLHILKDSFDMWYVASLPGARGQSKERLKDALEQELGKNAVFCNKIKDYSCVKDALHAAVDEAHAEDTIIVFGSFVTVGEAGDCVDTIVKREE